MSYKKTNYYKLRKPKVGDDFGQWGVNMNINMDIIDNTIHVANRKSFDLNVGVPENGIYLGDYSGILTGASITSTPINSGKFGTSRLIFDVDAECVITVAGTSVKQNTLNEASDVEQIVCYEPGSHVSQKYWTGDLSISSDVPITSDVYTYGGFSLDKQLILTKMILRAVTNTAPNDLSAKLIIFGESGNKLDVIEHEIQAVVSAPSTYRVSWVRELSINEPILRNVREFVVKLNSSAPALWSNVFITLSWE